MDSITVFSNRPKISIDSIIFVFALIVSIGMQALLYILSNTTSIYVNLLNAPILLMALMLVYKTRKLSYNKLTITQKDIKGEYGNRLFYSNFNDNVDIVINKNSAQLKLNNKKYTFNFSEEDITRIAWFIKRNDLRCLNENLGNTKSI